MKKLLTRRAALLPVVFGAMSPAREPEAAFRQLRPPEEAPPNAELVALVARMREIVERRDTAALLALMRPEFRVDFDTGKGPAAFRKRWAPESHESPVWPLLRRLLSLEGVALASGLFVLPYAYARFPMDLDLLAHVVATGSDVPLHEAPEPGAPVWRRVDHAILPLAKPLEPPVSLLTPSFLEVAGPEARRSYVSTADVYSPAGYRLFLEQRKGGWRWISLACATLAYPPDLQRLERKRGQ